MNCLLLGRGFLHRFHPFRPVLCEDSASAATTITSQFKLNYRQIFIGSSLGLAAGFALGKLGRLFIVACSAVFATIAYINSKGLIRINWPQLQQQVIGPTEQYTGFHFPSSGRFNTQSTFPTIRNWICTNPNFKLSFFSAMYVGFVSS
ncbi:integral mitochondrial outer membrane (MOM) protein [Schizosaccharomyces pombe]|uniref:Uncharacterized protein C29A4.17c n=1 Tax=Schizosaccharomyces pombe (strain 972 / ATCC 24843) TaxID=284812 RepID=YDPH_SCHPO|nr:mitocondrial FUN14 family protein [Schizosaccharomyces pombe]O14020.2 RecName: Full=Uncharacterized protein C29A4.17c [Schizosaccharomyces pombe 972h-]CAB10143.2 mitocondrial FUN14 family protein [Schizosaccharomyces pombe]|eukprot:NP_594865.1 mitocondrial FUN14 family protein [Schizosaccharomyces pombe]